MPTIAREDVVGQRVCSIYVLRDEIEGDGRTTYYFTLGNGVSFLMPVPTYPWETIEVPAEANEAPDIHEEDVYLVKKHWLFGELYVRQEPTKVDIVRRIKEQTIAGVYCPKMEDPECYGPDDCFLMLEDGSRVYDFTIAPTGVAPPGLQHFPRNEKNNDADLVDFFSVPVL